MTRQNSVYKHFTFSSYFDYVEILFCFLTLHFCDDAFFLNVKFSRSSNAINDKLAAWHFLELNEENEKMAAGGKRVSCGLDFVSPSDITNALQIATEAK